MAHLRLCCKTKVKVLFAFYQVATNVSETYLVTYPRSVERVLDVFSFVNMRMSGLGLPLACVKLGGFENKLKFMMLAPVGVLLFTKVVGWCRRDRSHERALIESSRAANSRALSSIPSRSTWRVLDAVS